MALANHCHAMAIPLMMDLVGGFFGIFKREVFCGELSMNWKKQSETTLSITVRKRIKSQTKGLTRLNIES